MTNPGFARTLPNQNITQPVSILELDAASNQATALTSRQSHITVDLSYHVGVVQVTPSPGEQWYVKMVHAPNGSVWVLDSKIPFNTPEITTPATEGQQQVGTGAGPIQLHGTQVNANGPLRLVSGSILSGLRRAGGRRLFKIGMGVGDSGLPDATGVDAGSLAYDESTSVPTYSDGTQWNTLATGAEVASKYVLPPGGVPPTDLSSSVQGALSLASSALQNIPANSVGATNIVAGAVGTTQLAPTVQSSLTLANSALQNLSGSPYDLSIMAFAATSVRAAGSGDNPFGIKLQRGCRLTSVTFRGVTADGSGSMTVQLLRNGTAITGTSTTIAAANQVSGGTSAFSQTCSAGDIIVVSIVSTGSSPGLGLVADITGVMT